MNDAPLPDGWRLASLAELGEVNRGRSRHRPRYADHLYGGPYPFIQTGDIRTSGGRITSHSTTYSEAGLAQSRLWPAETMCITIAANIAETAILTYPSCFPDSVVGFIADSTRADVRFVEYAFRLLKRRLQQAAMGSVQDNINLEILSRLRLPIPSLPEQRAIAAVLGSLDDKIEQNRRTGSKLEGLARGVFKAWFVDFEPVKAKAAGATAFPGMPPDTFAALPTRFTNSDLGPVPDGWVDACVEDLGSVVCGKTPSTKDAANFGDDIAFITIPDMHGKVFITETARRLSLAGAGSQQGKYVPERSVCVSCIATPGLVALTSSDAQTNQQINTVIPRAGIDPHFCYQLLCRLGDQIRAGGSGGSVFHNLNKSSFSAIRITLPEGGQIDAYGAFAKPIFDTMLAHARESAKLATLRDYLLPRLLSGRVRVNEAQCEMNYAS